MIYLEYLAVFLPALLVHYRPEGVSTGFTISSFAAGSATYVGGRLLARASKKITHGIALELPSYPHSPSKECNVTIPVLSSVPSTEPAKAVITPFASPRITSNSPTITNVEPALASPPTMSPRLTSESPASPTFLCRSPKLHGDTLTCRISSTQRTQIERHLSLSDLEISLPLVFHMVAPRSDLPPAPLSHVLSSPNTPSASICSIWETISEPRPFCTVLDNARFPSKASRSGPMCAVRNTIPLEPVLECPAIEPLLWMPFNRQSISRPASISQPPPFCAILEAPKPAPTCPVQNTIPLEPVLECPAIEPLLWMPSERQSASRPVSISPPRPICSIFEAPKPAPTCAVQNISPLERVLECSAIEPLLWTPSKRKSHSRPVCPVPSRLPPQGNATAYFNFNLPFGLVLLIMILLKGMLSVWFSWLQPTQQPVHKLLEIDAPQCDRETLIDAVVTLLLSTPPEDCDMIMAHINSEDEDSAIDTSSAAVIEDNVNDNGNARQELDLASVLLPYALSPSDARNDTLSEQLEAFLLQLLPEDDRDCCQITPETIILDLPESDTLYDVASSPSVLEDTVDDNVDARQELDLAAVLLPHALSPSGVRNDTLSEQIEAFLLQLLPENARDSSQITPETIILDLPEDTLYDVALDSTSSSGTLVSLASIDPHTVERDAPVSGSLSASSSATATSENEANIKKKNRKKKNKKKKN